MKSILLIFSLIQICLSERLKFSKEEGLFLGTQDDYEDDLLEKRIFQGNDTKLDVRVEEIDSTERLELELGVSDWGPMSTTLLMTSYEKDYKKAELPCSITPSSLGYHMLHSAELPKFKDIYSWYIHNNQIFLLTSSVDVFFYEVNSPQTEGTHVTLASIIADQDNSGLESPRKFIRDNTDGVDPDSAAITYDDANNLLYLVSSIGVVTIDVTDAKNKNFKQTFLGKDVMELHKDVVYTDILEGYLFIGYLEDGVFIYDIKDPAQIKLVGKFDKASFPKDKQENLAFLDFNVRNKHIGMYDNDDAEIMSKCLDCDTFYAVNFTLAERLEWLKSPVLKKPIMFIGTTQGVFAVNLKPLLEDGTFPEIYSQYLDIPFSSKITRFKDQLYILQIPRNKEGETKDHQNVYEIFLVDPTFDSWQTDAREDTSDKFVQNRKFKLENNATNIYTDEDYLYTIGDHIHMFYERGINSTFVPNNNQIGKGFVDKNLLTVMKMVIQGKDYVITVNNDYISLYQVRLQSPIQTCPLVKQKEGTDDPFYGKFEFTLNTTTRSCPEKMNNQIYNQSSADKFNYVCLFSKKLQLTIKKNIACFGSADCNMDTVFWHFVMLIGVIILVGLLLVWCCLKNNKRDYKQLEKQFADLKELKATMPNKKNPEMEIEENGANKYGLAIPEDAQSKKSSMSVASFLEQHMGNNDTSIQQINRNRHSAIKILRFLLNSNDD